MMNHKSFQLIVIFEFFLACLAGNLFSQMRDYKIHDRSMVHETVYNDGCIGRSYIVHAKTNLPLMEWPPRSRTTIQGKEYDGHHNIFGGGIYLSANEVGKKGDDNRLHAFCGAVGEGSVTEMPAGLWSFPISIEEIENFPIIAGEDGHGILNLDYDPDEAEEIIIAKWATATGISVTRTSRAWSYPDFDDMILYEYELEYTGDTDGNPYTQELDTTLVDVLFHVSYGFGPTMLAYFRWYGSWYYGDYGGIYRTDQRYSFDPDYWLLWQTCVMTKAEDSDELYAAKPEPDPDLFMEFATTGKNGGGLLAAACPGYSMLFWDTNHLSVVDPVNADKNESEYEFYMLKDATGNYFETDEDGYLLQPWNMKTETPRAASDKLVNRACGVDERWWTVYGELTGRMGDFPSKDGRFVLPNNPQTGQTRTWKGRARFEWDETYNGGFACTGFGPYKLNIGDKLEFAVAEVVGYGGTPGKIACGGQRDYQFYPVRDWNRKVVLDGQTMTEHYLDDFGYPDHINSDVITVNQVAHKAHEAYLGQEIPYDSEGMGPEGGMIFPEDNPRPSQNSTKYQIPEVPVPAPVIKVRNMPNSDIEITWNRVVETFNHDRIMGNLEKFYIFRADYPGGPWAKLDSFEVGDVNSDNLYEYIDSDQTYKLGETKYYAVTSVDEYGNQSGKTNFIAQEKDIGSYSKLYGDKLRRVRAVPNPYIRESGFTGGREGESPERFITFYGLTERCTIRIFSFSGQLVETIEHDDVQSFQDKSEQVSLNAQDFASGIYFYVVTNPQGEQAAGKLIIVK